MKGGVVAMRTDLVRALAISMVLLAPAASLTPFSRHVSADPSITDNPDGTSDAVWNFTNPADYTFTNTEILGSNATLERQPTFWWNSTTQADFSGPDSATNIDLNRWPGDVAMAIPSGPGTLLTLQPGATGEDAWLEKTNPDLNHGAGTTLVLDGRNPDAQPILRFDISAIPASAVIDGARLSLYQSAGFGNSFTASLHHVVAQWNEAQVTWNDRLTGIKWGTSGGDFSGRVIDQTFIDNTAGWRTWNVTQLVDLWHRGRLPNYGLLIEGPNPGADSDKTFYSSDYAIDSTRRPKLEIWYRVVGATAEYISKVGGPGTIAAWKNISWNPSVRDLASDEFNGASLDPKWAWTNPPSSYDVGVTTPGSLHVVSSTGTDFTDGTFTGNVLSERLVGDFTAIMKYSVNPAVNGQKSGLMILVDNHNWYSISKTNVGGPRNWRVYATDDAATTVRVDVASGNPVPAWVRIRRVGNTFTASTSTNGAAWTVRDTYTPSFEYTLGVRAAFFVTDGFSGTALPVDVDYIRFILPNDATVTVQTRIGDTNPVDATWSGWSAPYPSSSASPMTGSSRWVDYRLFLSVTNPGHMPVIGDVNISYFRYPPAGTIETNDLVPADLSAWGNFTVVENLNGQTISYQYSLDSGSTWIAVTPPANLRTASIATGKIRFRASLSTANTLITPVLEEIRLTYTHRLDHFYVTAPSSAVAGAPFAVTVTAKDILNATMTSWTGIVALEARLPDGITPGGGVLGTTSLVIPAGGAATLATETYTKAETIRIFSNFSTVTGLSDNITVSPGPVNRIIVTPDNVTMQAFASQIFNAQAYDSYNNAIPGVNFTWAVGGGVGSLNISWGQDVLFTSNPPAANGTLQASFGPIIGTAQIHVILGTPPWIAISSPASGSLLTGVVPIVYTNSTDSISVQFDYNDGMVWTPIGSTATLNGTYYWDTSGLNFVSGSLLATVTNNVTATNMTIVSPIDVDNTPPTITIGAVVDNQAVDGTLTIGYTTDSDVVRIDFTYFDGSWHTIGSDFTIDGSCLWNPGVPINGVTLRAVAIDHVNLTGWDEEQGVGSYIIGSRPPSIAPIPDLHVRVAVTYTLNLTFYVTDPDTPLAALAVWDSDPANVTANPGAYPFLDVTYGSPGMFMVTLWVSDGTDTAWRVIRIIASAQSPPVLISPIPTVIFDEDTVAVNGLGAPGTAFFNDPDGDPQSFAVLDAANISSQVNADDTIDFWAPMNWFGSETLRLRAMDPSGGFAESVFLVIVRSVNDPPVLVTPFPAISFNENSTALDAFGGNATSNFYDADGDPLIISILGGVNISSIINPNGTVHLWGATNWSGSETLRVRATDSSGDFAEGPFVVTVMPVNHAPVLLSPIPDITFDEDTVTLDAFAGPISAFFFDRNGDPLSFTILGGVQVSTRINANLTVDFWATANWDGSETLLVRATDPNGSSAEALFTVTVRPVNDPPVLIAQFSAIAFDEDAVAINAFGGAATTHFFDVDGDPLTLIVLGGVQVSSRINPDGTVDLWAAANWSGLENLRVRATDPSGSFAEGSFPVTVRPVNDAPIALSAIPTVSFDEDTVRLDAFGGSPAFYFFDRDGDPLTFTVLGATRVLFEINADLTVDFWAPRDWFGSEILRLRVTDPSGAFAEATFLVIVLPVNDPPVLAPIAELQIDDGATITLDLTPYISDVDTNMSEIFATTDSPYVTANGRVLTIAFPAGQTDTVFTVTISDGTATASQSVRISFSPVWWRSPYTLAVIPFGILLVVGMIAQRARWRPAKAFLVDDRRRLLREFTLDPRCEVTYEQVSQAGALDAVEKAVKVEKYHAQTVQGDALAVCLLAYGPVSMEQVEFAREMLVNVQDKFDENVKIRLRAARTAENNLEDSNRELQAKWDSLRARSKAFEGALDVTTTTMTKLEREAASIRTKVASFSQWQNRLKQQEQVVERETHEMEALKASLDKRAQGIERMEMSLVEQEKTLGAEQHEIESARKEFDAEWRGKSESIAAKEIEFESKEQSLHDKEEQLQSQSEEHALLLSQLTSQEADLKEEAEKIAKAHAELAAREQENEKVSKTLEAKAATILEIEARKAEEFRSWQETMESQQVLLHQQHDAFDQEMKEQQETLENRLREIEKHEANLAEQQMRIQTNQSRIDRAKDDLARCENEVKQAMQAATEAQTAAEAAKKIADERASELEQRERALREEATRLSDEFAKRADMLKNAEAELASRNAHFDEEVSARVLQVSERESELNKMAKALEARSRELAGKEAGAASAQSTLKEREDRLAREEADLDATAKLLETREIDFTQATVRQADESGRLHAEAGVVRQSLAAKEAELKSDQERLERESAALQDRLSAKALELSEFDKSLAAREAKISHDRQALDAERAAWAASKEKEFNQLEASRQDVSEQTQRSEKLIEEAQRRAYVATELENMMKRHAEEIREMEARLEERRLAAEKAERAAEAQVSQLNEAARRLGSREVRIQSATSEIQAREARLVALENSLSKTSEELATKRYSLEQEAKCLSASSSELEAHRAELEERETNTQARLADIAQREQALTADFQRLENMTEDLRNKESDVKSREQFIISIQKDITKRDSILSKLEVEVRRNMEDVDRERKELESRVEEAQSSRAQAHKAREEALSLRARAEKEKTEAENMQKELQKNMKFLQKKAMELLDKEEKLRTREVKITEAEDRIQTRDDLVQERERSLEKEREELAEKANKTQAEVVKLKEKLAEAVKDTASTAEMEEWRRDIESRVKIVQKKAMEILNREEKLRKKESELRKVAEKLGVQFDESEVVSSHNS